MSTTQRISDALTIVGPDPGATPSPAVDSWALGRARLVAFKTERLLTSAQRELGAFGDDTLSADLATELIQASEHVGEALAVLAAFQRRLQGGSPEA